VFWPARLSGISSRNWRITLGIYAHVFPGMNKEAMKEMDEWFRNDDERTNPAEKGE
jgi:hypothetical protein